MLDIFGISVTDNKSHEKTKAIDVWKMQPLAFSRMGLMCWYITAANVWQKSHFLLFTLQIFLRNIKSCFAVMSLCLITIIIPTMFYKTYKHQIEHESTSLNTVTHVFVLGLAPILLSECGRAVWNHTLWWRYASFVCLFLVWGMLTGDY